MSEYLRQFLKEDSGAISVDWVVLSAAAVSMAIATTDVLDSTIDDVSSRLEAQLRNQQLSDDFVQFTSADFEDFYQAGTLTEEQAGDLFNAANELMNGDIIAALEAGIPEKIAGTLTAQEEAALQAIASVAHQRNIVDDAVLFEHFGIGTDPSGGTDV